VNKLGYANPFSLTWGAHNWNFESNMSNQDKEMQVMNKNHESWLINLQTLNLLLHCFSIIQLNHDTSFLLVTWLQNSTKEAFVTNVVQLPFNFNNFSPITMQQRSSKLKLIKENMSIFMTFPWIKVHLRA
jgi:hypothetical protein